MTSIANSYAVSMVGCGRDHTLALLSDGKVIGWGVKDASAPELAYTLFTAGDIPIGGLMELPEEGRRLGATPRWVGYVAVDDIDDVLAEPRGRAELRLVVNAGSMQEEDSQRGLAHFLEHMEFNGTEHFAKGKLVDYLESIGMGLGADINAATNFDETVYKLTIPSDSVRFVKNGLPMNLPFRTCSLARRPRSSLGRISNGSTYRYGGCSDCAAQKNL